jgi:Domain of unknown function (DUF4365)
MRKQRTRQHIIEDLGFNHVERQVLYAGYAVYRYGHNDYGLDGSITTFNDNGEFELLNINFQLKSTDKLHLSVDKKFCIFDVSRRDLELWLLSDNPILFILYDAQNEISYYVNLVEYFTKDGFDLNSTRKYARLKIPSTHIWNKEEVTKLRHTKKRY